MIKYVLQDEVQNYNAEVAYAENYFKAREIMSEIEERFHLQAEEPDSMKTGMIMCEPVLVEIELDQVLNKRSFSVDEMLFCKRCNKYVEKCVVHTSLSAEVVWNSTDQSYEVAEEEFSLEDATSVYCSGCCQDLLKQ